MNIFHPYLVVVLGWGGLELGIGWGGLELGIGVSVLGVWFVALGIRGAGLVFLF
ncbi:hypothetical protein ACTHQ4_20605 [Alkalicoccobacillus gibsonii]|uniref:hypothetical protein n=1 Tax=Alkalicoccobacillus gibsonii TaxID=79881 RepID=UPI003F7C24D7